MAVPLLSSCLHLLWLTALLAMAFCAGSIETEKHGNRKQVKKSHRNEYPTGQRTGTLPKLSSSHLDPATGKARIIDPRDAWMLLMKQSNKDLNSKKRGKSKSKKFKFGIPGPSGSPGALTTQEEMLREFRLLLKGIIRERERMNLKACDNCQVEENWGRRDEVNFLAQSNDSLLETREQRRVVAAFRCRTRKNISIDRRSLQELNFYYLPKKGEQFHRGLGLNLTNGQYVAPFSGYYIFTATLRVVFEEYSRKSLPRSRGRLRLLICVQSLCQQNMSLETVAGLATNNDPFTISVNGILFLQLLLEDRGKCRLEQAPNGFKECIKEAIRHLLQTTLPTILQKLQNYFHFQDGLN